MVNLPNPQTLREGREAKGERERHTQRVVKEREEEERKNEGERKICCVCERERGEGREIKRMIGYETPSSF